MESAGVDSGRTGAREKEALWVCFCLNLFQNCSTPERTRVVGSLPETCRCEKRRRQQASGKLGALAVSVSEGRPWHAGMFRTFTAVKLFCPHQVQRQDQLRPPVPETSRVT